MSGDFSFAAKIVSPIKCNEKPWDLWVSEIGHLSPRPDDEGSAEGKSGASARLAHPYKTPERAPPPARHRRAGLNRLRHDSMSLHGLMPQIDNLNAAVCHMCGVVVKCSAAYRHLLDSHTDTEPILPPPAAPTVKLKVVNRSRLKKDNVPPPLPIDILPVKMETSPVHTATAPLSRLVLPQPEMYLDDAGTASVTGEVQVCVESGELPVVSILDPEDQTLGAEDILEIMNSEGIQSADNITNAADWNNIIRDIGNMQEMNFPQTTDSTSQDLYGPVDTSSLSAYAITDSDLSSLQFTQNTSPMLSSSVLDTNVMNISTQPPKPTPTTPSTKSQSRSKTSKTKFNLREYDPNKHCGVVTAENPKPCTRSLTCKAHALSLRRTVEGRSKPFDTLLAEHRAARDAGAAPPAAAATAAAAVTATAAAAPLPPLLVSAALDLGGFNGLTADQQVNDIYASILGVEQAAGALPEPGLAALLGPPLPAELLSPTEGAPDRPERERLDRPAGDRPADPPQLVPADVCWYSACPRPLALCTFNAAHAGGAITLGKKFATVRSNIKSSLSRSQCKTTGGSNSYYYNQNALSLSKSVHMNASKTNKPEVRKLIVTCSAGAAVSAPAGGAEAGEWPARLNGHAAAGRRRPAKRPAAALDLAFALDPLLADEKC